MTHRTQIILEDEQYALLRRESARSGSSLAALVRAAVDQRFGRAAPDAAAALDVLDQTAGAWSQLEVDGATYVTTVRRARWRTDTSSDDGVSE